MYKIIQLIGIPDRLYHKLLLIMRLTTVILIASLVQVSASTFAQRLSLQRKGITLEQVFKEIRNQTGYDILLSTNEVKVSSTIDADFKNETVEEVMNRIISGKGMTYSIEDKTILLKKKEPSFLDRVLDRFSAIDVRGRVVSAETGEALAGATVKVKGTSKSVSTDVNGDFFLSDVDEKGVIVISFVGYKPVELAAVKEMGAVRLEMSSGELEEVMINKGYYSTTKELNTGSVGLIRGENISRQPVSDPLLALQGSTPGLFIQQTNGAPGRAVTVRIRGQNSIANGNEPLYIVDGVPFTSSPLTNVSVSGFPFAASPLNDLNPSDIEKIEVLKDADATAIYGSRGANGVILIQTKRGKIGTTQVDANFYIGSGKVTRMYDLMNTEQYLSMRRDALKNDDITTPGFSDYDLNGTWSESRDTDWQKILIGGTAKIMNSQLGISGGNQQTQFRISGNYYNEGTVYPGNFGSSKGSGQISIKHRSENNRFIVTYSGTFVAGINQLPPSDLTSSIFLAPNAPKIYNDDRTLNWENSSWNNPLADARKKYKEKTDNLISNLVLDYNLLEGLKLKGNFGFNRENLRQRRLVPYTAINSEISSDPLVAREHEYGDTKNQTWLVEPQISYHTEIGKGIFDFLFGTTFQATKSESLAQFTNGYSSDDLIENLKAASSTMTLSNYMNEYRYNALYGRLSYSHQSKYILNLTARRDGSSRFGHGKQFGNFGAVGVAWIFSKESLIADNVKFLNFGKIRTSFGITGNDKLPDYKYLSTYSAYGFSYQGSTGLYPTQHTNPYFGWERVDKFEGAIDLSFLNDRISCSATWYKNRTRNQLVGYGLPDITGFPVVQGNLPAIVQNKGLELDLTTTPFKNRKLSWSTSLNVSFPKNKLVSYPNIKSSSYATLLEVGRPLNVTFLYEYNGVDPTTQLYSFKDLNGDGQITYANDRRAFFQGQKFFGGWNNTLKYASFQLNLLTTFANQTAENTFFNIRPGAFGQGKRNQPVNVLHGQYPQPYTTLSGSPAGVAASRYIESSGKISDASYMRLKNITMAWVLPSIWTQRLSLTNVKFFVSGQNILTLTRFKGLDPEVTIPGLMSVPPLKIFTAGINITL